VSTATAAFFFSFNAVEQIVPYLRPFTGLPNNTEKTFLCADEFIVEPLCSMTLLE
jgi:hypothetical protein